MHITRFLIIFCCFLQAPAATTAVDADDVTELPDYSRGYDPGRNPFDDGRAALALANDTGRLVLIEVGGDWCRWCHVLDGFVLDNPAVYAKLHRNFVLLKVNTSDANENAEFLSGLPRTSGYPHLFISHNNGSLIGSTDTTRLIVSGRYDRQRFLAFLDHWIELGAAQRLSSNSPPDY